MPTTILNTTGQTTTSISASFTINVSGGLTDDQASKVSLLPDNTIYELSQKVDVDGSKVLSDINYSTAEQTKVTNATTHLGNTNNPHSTTKTHIGLGNVNNTSDANKPVSIAQQAALDLKANSTDIDTINTTLSSKADLVGGKVPASQLPDGIDEVQEYANVAAFPVTGATNIIYVATDVNKQYRWGGTQYSPTDSGVALGETSSTAHRGDHGAAAYTHSLSTSNPHGVTKNQVGLSNVDNTSDANKPISDATQIALDAKLTTSDALITLGLENVDNTSDTDKPVSTAQQAAITAVQNLIPTTTANISDIPAKRFVSDAQIAVWDSYSASPVLTDPTSFIITSGDSQNTISFIADVNADSHVLQFHTGDFVWANVSGYNGTDTTSIIHSGLTNGTTYYYRLYSQATGYTNSGIVYGSAMPRTTVSDVFIDTFGLPYPAKGVILDAGYTGTASSISWRTADDTSGTNEAEVGTSQTYTPVIGDIGKYFRLIIDGVTSGWLSNACVDSQEKALTANVSNFISESDFTTTVMILTAAGANGGSLWANQSTPPSTVKRYIVVNRGDSITIGSSATAPNSIYGDKAKNLCFVGNIVTVLDTRFAQLSQNINFINGGQFSASTNSQGFGLTVKSDGQSASFSHGDVILKGLKFDTSLAELTYLGESASNAGIYDNITIEGCLYKNAARENFQLRHCGSIIVNKVISYNGGTGGASQQNHNFQLINDVGTVENSVFDTATGPILNLFCKGVVFNNCVFANPGSGQPLSWFSDTSITISSGDRVIFNDCIFLNMTSEVFWGSNTIIELNRCKKNTNNAWFQNWGGGQVIQNSCTTDLSLPQIQYDSNRFLVGGSYYHSLGMGFTEAEWLSYKKIVRDTTSKQFGSSIVPQLSTPANFTAGDNENSQVTLNWDSVTDAEGYELEKRVQGTGLYATVAGYNGTDVGFIDTNVTNGTVYDYQVRAIAQSGFSPSAWAQDTGSPNLPDTQGPVLSNFRILDANKDRIYFDTDEIVTGTTYGGFTLGSGKTITGLSINAGQLTGHYFTVNSAYTYADGNDTIAYSGSGSNIQDTEGTPNPLDAFGATSVSNNIANPAATYQMCLGDVNGTPPRDFGSGDNYWNEYQVGDTSASSNMVDSNNNSSSYYIQNFVTPYAASQYMAGAGSAPTDGVVPQDVYNNAAFVNGAVARGFDIVLEAGKSVILKFACWSYSIAGTVSIIITYGNGLTSNQTISMLGNKSWLTFDNGGAGFPVRTDGGGNDNKIRVSFKENSNGNAAINGFTCQVL